MCPMFSVKALSHLFPKTIDDDNCKTGWGLDTIWPILLPPNSVAVVDVVQVEHTRPANAFRVNSTATSYLNVDPRLEEHTLFKKFNIGEVKKIITEIVEENIE